MWDVDQGRAIWRTDGLLKGSIQIANCSQGLHAIQWKGNPVNGSIFQIKTAAATTTLPDHYVRGDDLIVNYPSSIHRDVFTQVYWRGSVPADASCVGCLDVIVSMQTDLLASDPGLMIESRLPAGEIMALPADGSASFKSICDSDEASDAVVAASAIVLLRPDGLDWTFAQAVFPTDLVTGQVQREAAADQVVIRASLFSDSLEKGVIRRGRLRGAFLPRENDLEAASKCVSQFLESSTPLTA